MSKWKKIARRRNRARHFNQVHKSRQSVGDRKKWSIIRRIAHWTISSPTVPIIPIHTHQLAQMRA